MTLRETPSPAMYEERIRLLEAENQRLRDALIAIAHLFLSTGVLDRINEALDGTPSAAE